MIEYEYDLPLDLSPQPHADLHGEAYDQDAGEDEDGSEDDEGAQPAGLGGEQPPGGPGPRPRGQQHHRGQGEAADHVLVRPTLPQRVQSPPAHGSR